MSNAARSNAFAMSHTAEAVRGPMSPTPVMRMLPCDARISLGCNAIAAFVHLAQDQLEAERNTGQVSPSISHTAINERMSHTSITNTPPYCGPNIASARPPTSMSRPYAPP